MRKTVLKGALGKALQRTVDNRLKLVDYDQLVEPFAKRNEADGAWRCEFWGKIVRSAITAAYYTGDTELRAMLDKTVKDMMATQTADGCISSYPADKQLTGWDLWGRKYTLLALLRYYEMLNPDPGVLKCCCKMVDHLMSQVGENKADIRKCGFHGGLAPASILGAIVAVWKLSKDQKYRDFAEYIIASGCSSDGNIFESALAGVVPAALGNGKAYEMTSCFQGLAELYMLDPNPRYKEACEKYFAAVQKEEIFITGTGGCKDRWGEYWDQGALRQTESGYTGGLGETCVTATWLHYCERIADLTLEAAPFEEAERSLYNSILGAMSADGASWMHVNPTPLTGNGYKFAAGDQIGNNFGTPFGGNDCCRAQGPEALALAAKLAVVARKDNIDINMFEALTADIDGNIKIEISGNYPVAPNAEIKINTPEITTIRLRIPRFIKRVTLNGKPLDIQPGSYLSLTRQWLNSDIILMEFDFSLQEISSPDGGNYIAFMRGPLLLAADSRMDVPDALVSVSTRNIGLIDYITAGNQMCKENTLTVWFPNQQA